MEEGEEVVELVLDGGARHRPPPLGLQREDGACAEGRLALDLVRLVNKSSGEEQAALAGQLKHLGGVLGCLQSDPEEFLQAGAGDDAAWIEEMIQKRIDAKKARDFATADAVRDELLAKGIVLRDGPDGTSWSKQ